MSVVAIKKIIIFFGKYGYEQSERFSFDEIGINTSTKNAFVHRY